MEDRFLEQYNRLNAQQREAVDTIEGPVMVIAGPGTGKTQILTLRIANILRKTDTAPENILALTFTEAGARAMRERLRGYIGGKAHKVEIRTFHEFASGLIRAYPDAYERAIGGRPATDLEKFDCIEQVLETGGIKLLRPRGNPQFYVRSILGTIALLKREYVTPDHLAEIIAKQDETLGATPKLHEKGAHKGKVRSEYQKLEKEIQKNRELLNVYRTYDTVLADQHLYDFEDMIYETVQALERNEDMLRDLQERFQYVLADEHQDVNGSQNRILELLAAFHDRPNLFVVGDEKQSIFRFQGASLENFLYFEEKFPHAKTIALTDNYRSAQNILDFAHALITVEETPASALRTPLSAARTEPGMIEWREYAHEAIEDDALIARVQEIAKGTPLGEIAIIVRSNKEVEHYAQRLRSSGIPADATADGDILRHPVTASVRAFITTLLEPSNETALFSVLHEPYWGIATPDLVRIVRERSYARPLSAIIQDEEFLMSLGLTNIDTVLHVARTIQDVRARIPLTPPHRLIADGLSESGFVDHVMQHDPFEGGRALRRLYDEVEGLVRAKEAATLQDVARMFALRLLHGLPLTAPYIKTGGDAVQVMTAHKSKGLEFSHVCIPHLTSRGWGDTTHRELFKIPIASRIPTDAFDELDDERKLLYVALTRAKESLSLSYAKENTEGRTQSETALFDEVREQYADAVSTDVESDAFNAASAFAPTVRVAIDPLLLSETLKERGLSATALNNYLKSPWDYLYRNVLRMPEIKSESAQFGTAIHGALASVTHYRREHNSLPSIQEIKNALERELSKLPLSVHEYTRLHEHGLEILAQYVAFFEQTLPPHTREESRFEAVLPTNDPLFPEVRLTGALDRLDFDRAPHEGGQLIRVLDYKTGKPKTRGQIEGTTQDSDGGYKRQLVFYALLLSLQDDERLKTREFVLSFVEADDKGKVHEERYIITDEEIEELKIEIIRVAHEITRGAFLDMSCDPETSDYCHLVGLLKKR